jgi:predicted amidophosphoribosyltransferase
MPEALMPFYICENCAFETQDPTKKICERCNSELLLKCPYCGKPMDKARTIYCGHCGEKLKISICPIQ